MSVDVAVCFPGLERTADAEELQRVTVERDRLKTERDALAAEIAELRKQLAETKPALAADMTAKIAAVEKTRLLTPKMLERLAKKLAEGVTAIAAVEYATGSGTNTRAVKTINILQAA